MSSYHWRVQPLIDRYLPDLPRRQAIKIAAQVERLRSDRELLPGYKRLRRLHDRIYRVLVDAREQDHESAEIIVKALNDLWTKRLEAYKGDIGQMEDALAQAYLLRRKYHRERSASERVGNLFHLRLQLALRSGV